MRKLPTTKEILVEIYARKENAPPFSGKPIASAVGSAMQDGNGGTAFAGSWFDDGLTHTGHANINFSDSFILPVGRPPKSLEKHFSTYLKGRIAIACKGTLSDEFALNVSGLSKSTFDYAKKAIKPHVDVNGGWFVSKQPDGKIIAGIFLSKNPNNTESGPAYILLDGNKTAKYLRNVTVKGWNKPSKL